MFLFLTKGYSLAPAAQIGPFTYGLVVYSALFGWMFWGETMGLATLIGAILICAAGLASLWGSA